jgi:hypothetical protein
MIFWIPVNIIFFSKMLFMFDDAMRLKLDDDDDGSGDDDDEEEEEDTRLGVSELMTAASSGDGEMTEAGYLRFMLVGAGICSPEILDEFSRRFAELDDHFGGHGHLNSDMLRRSLSTAAATRAPPFLESEAIQHGNHTDDISLVQMNAF